MKTRPLDDLIRPTGRKAGQDTEHPVFSVTKHAGFVRSTDYFKKQVFSRELSNYKRVCAGDFAYATIHLDEGSIGIAPADGLISPMYTVFRPVETLVDPNYLLRYLKSPIALAQYPRFGKGSVHRRKAISLRALGQLPVPLPDLQAQRRIAEILNRADLLRAKRRKASERIEMLKHSIFLEMFGDHELAQLGQSLEFVTSGGRGWAKYYAPVGEPFIRSVDVRFGSVASDALASVAAPVNAEAKRTKTQVGDVLLTITGSRIGRASILPGDLAGAYVSQHVAILRPKADVLEPNYLSAFLCSPMLGQRQIMAAQYGQTKPGLNFEQIRNFRLPAADLDQQLAFRDRVRKAAQIADDAGAAEHELDTFFASLQSRAFSGQL